MGILACGVLGTDAKDLVVRTLGVGGQVPKEKMERGARRFVLSMGVPLWAYYAAERDCWSTEEALVGRGGMLGAVDGTPRTLTCQGGDTQISADKGPSFPGHWLCGSHRLRSFFFTWTPVRSIPESRVGPSVCSTPHS